MTLSSGRLRFETDGGKTLFDTALANVVDITSPRLGAGEILHYDRRLRRAGDAGIHALPEARVAGDAEEVFGDEAVAEHVVERLAVETSRRLTLFMIGRSVSIKKS